MSVILVARNDAFRPGQEKITPERVQCLLIVEMQSPTFGRTRMDNPRANGSTKSFVLDGKNLHRLLSRHNDLDEFCSLLT